MFLLTALMASSLVACNKVGFSPVVQTSATCEEQGNCTNTGSGESVQERTVTVQGTSAVDILFVVDSSISMDREREALGNRLSAFVSKLQGLDWRLCVTTTDPSDDGEPLRFSNGAYYLTPSVSNASTLFLNRLTSINSESPTAGDEQGVGAIYSALDHLEYGCIRDEAALSTIVLSDEDERSTGGYPNFQDERSYHELMPWNLPANVVSKVERMWEGEKSFVAHSIVVSSGNQACYADQSSEGVPVWYGTRYEQLSNLTGGIIGNICADDYSTQLQDFAKRIQGSLSFVSLECNVESLVDVVVSPRPANLKTRVASNKIYFEPAIPAGTSATVRYRCASAGSL